ncbi:MAG: hypothetical protein CBC27_03410 [Opitutia bacterium TMED67]|nr:MAG: hypothetical protein CBC27_03410 [Opitutae bacterium TMED67]|tara:strand:+ start:51 stop:1076 length:1026 start_codon:yes stop_codon:yes gene_type:complete
MANGDTSPSRLGLVNATGTATDALFLKVFSNEILTTFDEANIMKDLHTVRTISSGKSAQFPVTGIATAAYHEPGKNILESSNGYLSNIRHAEKVISIDDMLISSTFIANIDEVKNHYSVRSIYAKEIGKALAKRFDLAVMKTWVAAARSPATITGGSAGTSVNTGNGLNSATELIDALFGMAQSLDEKDVPNDGQRFAVLTPAQYYKLLTTDNLAVNRDVDGSGSVSKGTVPMVAGIKLFKSQHLQDLVTLGAEANQDQDDDKANNDIFGGVSGTAGTGYNADFSDTGFIGGHPGAVGSVKLLDLATESSYEVAHQGTLFLAKYALGHGILRPECAVEYRL